ncbi:MAG: GNAT family N-acetyltransferase [Gulosibacter sp.]|uniref:GNAT family N-acetyltransferase n=1 Tax=Gulosibacter sp. TaxID=2817531 RepID=UPI003F91E1DE
MAATLPEPDAQLEGRHIRLEPLTREGALELAPALRKPEVFAGGFGGGPAALPDSDDAFADWLLGYTPGIAQGRSYLIRSAADDGAIGTSSFYKVDAANRVVYLGYTAYAPEVWGQGVNPDLKVTLLSAAFAGGFHRAVFEVDNHNGRSQAAMRKVGAHFDGVLREDRLRADGSWRSTHVFSILEQDWPEIRVGLEARIPA